ncbi:hypothetical protein IRJ34_02070 [Paenarthrobacter sp. GOM3]|uniref:hypothetical protein n=1 Tax=Paenarthrobacter sp. GOM3 TaxID=2782567 RepID=UPI001BA62169|nr:hypothetical protein [Paenarthrobacter sp. GOM3]WOH19135.1 hypothetical protein IRJ34_02070 [Paenarthrobacter sp. GOM3]
MKKKLLLSVFAVGSLVGIGNVSSSQAAIDESVPSERVVKQMESDLGDGGTLEPAINPELPSADHPECYDTKKLDDPSDFCYRTIGPWNSTLSTDEEVRELVSIEQMVASGRTAAEIRRYYPEYTP